MESWHIWILVMGTIIAWFFLFLWLEDRKIKHPMLLATTLPMYFVAALVSTLLFFPVIAGMATFRYIERWDREQRFKDFMPNKKKSHATQA